MATGAVGQTNDPILLPTVEVETTEEPTQPRAVTRAPTKAKPAPRRAAEPRLAAPAVCTPARAGTPVCAAQEAAEREVQQFAQVQALKAAAGGSSYVDPDAPFKANTLSNSRMPGPLKDNPRTVTAITQEVLETTGTTSVRELARSTPGISLGFGEGGNSFGDNIYIRGFKANNDTYSRLHYRIRKKRHSQSPPEPTLYSPTSKVGFKPSVRRGRSLGNPPKN